MLREALRARGVADLTSTSAAVELYKVECSRLGVLAKEASRGSALQQVLDARQR